MSVTATQAFRRLLRAQRISFAGDLRTLEAARVKTREAFTSFAPSAEHPEETSKAIEHAVSVANFLEQNVAQATKMPAGAAAHREHYKVHIDPSRHELGDNETIRAKNKHRVKK